LNAAAYLRATKDNPGKSFYDILHATHKNFSRYYQYFGWKPDFSIDSDPLEYYVRNFDKNDEFRRDFIKTYSSRIDMFAITHFFSDYSLLFVNPESNKRFNHLDECDYAIYRMSLPIYDNVLNPKVENTWSLDRLSSFVNAINEELKVKYGFDAEYHM
jgi:hypothetical protein